MDLPESATIIGLSLTSAAIIYCGFYFENWQPVIRVLTITFQGLGIGTILYVAARTMWGTISKTEEGISYLESIDKKFVDLKEEIESVGNKFYRINDLSTRITALELSIDRLTRVVKKDSQTTSTANTEAAVTAIIS